MMNTSSNPAPNKIPRYGLSQVYAPVGHTKVDVVFVHGLNGHPEWTWTSDKSKIFWPAQLLPDVVGEEKARILVFGYDASITSFTDNVISNIGQLKTHHHAEHLVTELVANRLIRKATERPIIFVAHSLGGLIVKRALIYASKFRGAHTEHFRSVFISTYGILFLGTPHFGRDIAQLSPRLEWICNVAMPKNVFDSQIQCVEKLKKNNEDLQSIDQHFTLIMSKFRTYFFHEGLPSNLHGSMRFVLDEKLASPDIVDTERARIQQDHLHMCKFESDSTPGFDLVAEALQRFASDAPAIISNRWASEKLASSARKEAAMQEVMPNMLDRGRSYMTMQDPIQLPSEHDPGTSFDNGSPRLRPGLLSDSPNSPALEYGDEGYESEREERPTSYVMRADMPSGWASYNFRLNPRALALEDPSNGNKKLRKDLLDPYSELAERDYELPPFIGGGYHVKSSLPDTAARALSKIQPPTKGNWRAIGTASEEPKTPSQNLRDRGVSRSNPAIALLDGKSALASMGRIDSDRNDRSQKRESSPALHALGTILERNRSKERSGSGTGHLASALASESRPLRGPIEATDQTRQRRKSQKGVMWADQMKRADETATRNTGIAPDSEVSLISTGSLKLNQTKGLLEYNGHLLSRRASMLCLTLASCACDRVPAFFFTRPYYANQRRWNIDGEIEQSKLPEAAASLVLPQWPKSVFVETNESTGPPGEGKTLYEDVTLGCSCGANVPRFFTLTADIAELSSQNLVSFDLDEDCLLLAMHPGVKEVFWRQTSINDRLFIWFGLLQLVVYSFPDVYAEIMGQQIQWRCRDVVRSTIIPFLSVLGWSELSSNRILLPPLVSFLTHYFISDSYGLDLTVLFDVETMEHWKDSSDFRFFQFLGIYTKNIQQLSFDSQNIEHSEVLQNVPAPASLRLLASSNHFERDPTRLGLLGLVLDCQIRSARTAYDNKITDLLIEDWKAFIGTNDSTLLISASLLLGAGRDTSDKEIGLLTSRGFDPEMMATLGQALMFRGSYSKAYLILSECVDVILTLVKRNGHVAVPRLYHICVLELIKCCNITMVKDFDPLRVARSRYFKTASCLHRSCLNIELADWYMGQGNYVAAKQHLEQIFDNAESPDYIQIIVNLRLNKVDRRLRCLDESTLQKGGQLFKALTLVDHSKTDLSNECLDELRATMAFARWNDLDVAAAAKAVLTVNPTRPEENWRLSDLECQCEGMSACILGLPVATETLNREFKPPLLIKLPNVRGCSTAVGFKLAQRSEWLGFKVQRPYEKTNCHSSSFFVNGNLLNISETLCVQ